MIDSKHVENIKAYGAYRDTGEGRLKILKEDIGFRMDEKAKHVVVGGCLLPEGMPHVFMALRQVLDRLHVDYTMLSKEYCCGWVPLGQPAVRAKNDEDISRAKELARDFILENFGQAEALGAETMALFCAACEPGYSNYRKETALEIISYAELIDRYFEGGKMSMNADYYAGCYRFRRKITSDPLDLEPAVRVLNKIEGLKVNLLDNSLCCFVQPHLESIKGALMSNTMITICSGCYNQMLRVLKDKDHYKVKMLPEIVRDSLEPGPKNSEVNGLDSKMGPGKEGERVGVQA